MEGYLDYKRDSKAFIYAKLYDSLVEGKVALEMLGRGMLQNAAGKAFLAVKEAISALVVKNMNKILESKSGKERSWYEDVGYSAPTTGLIGISKDLEKLGIQAEFIAKTSLLLHKFSYNGFDPNFVDYKEEGEIVDDILKVVRWLLGLDKYFMDEWDERLERAREELEKMVGELEKKVK